MTDFEFIGKAAIFAALFVAFYAAHHFAHYWLQTDHQAHTKGKAGHEGRVACFAHVSTYVFGQAGFGLLTLGVLGMPGFKFWPFLAAMALSGAAHYFADRREPLRRLASLFPGKTDFWRLGMPREPEMVLCLVCRGAGGVYGSGCTECRGSGLMPARGDNPSLGTGAWALDQSWHLVTSVFLPALLIAALS